MPINNQINIRFTVLTPTFIGCGQENDYVAGVDFVIDRDHVLILSQERLMSLLDPSEIAQYSTCLLGRDGERLVKLFGEKRLNDACVKKVSLRELGISSIDAIKPMIKNQLSGNPLLVGSSLKGALMNVFATYLGVRGNKDNVFGTAKDGNVFSRFIKFHDVEFDSDCLSLVNTKIFNLFTRNGGAWQGGWKDGGRTSPDFNPGKFNTIYEALKPGATAVGSLLLCDELFKLYASRGDRDKQHVKSREKESLLQSPQTLFEVINAHTALMLKKDRAFFTKFSTAKTECIVDAIDDLLKKINENSGNSCVLRLSAGSGFHSITGDWQFDDYSSGRLGRKVDREDIEGKKLLNTPGGINPKSRKIAVSDDLFTLMGFVKLEVVDEKEAAEYMTSIQESRLKRVDSYRFFSDQKLQKQKVEETKRQQRLQEESERQNKYTELLEKLSDLKSQGKYSEAIEKIKESNLKDFFSDLKAEENALRLLLNEQKNNDEKQRLIDETRKKGLSMLLEAKQENGEYAVKDFKVCEKKVDKYLKDLNLSALESDADIEALRRTLQRLKSNSNKKELKLWSDPDSSLWETVEKWTNGKVNLIE